MYSGAHLTGRLGAAQCTGLVAAGERNSRTIPDTNSNTCAHTDSHAQTNPHANSRTESYADSNAHTVRILCSRVERHSGLYRGHDCQRERRELRGQLLDAKSEPDHK